MGQNLTGQLISATYEDLVQISGSILTDGLGNNINNLTVTSSFATTASFALNAGATVNTGSLMVTGSATSNVLTFTKGDGSTFNLTVATGSAVTVNTGSLMVTGSVSLNTLTFTKGDGSTFNLTVDTGSAVTVNTGSLLVTASISNATTTYTKGDGSTFALTVNNVQNAFTASIATSASFATSASQAQNAVTASFALSASYVDLGTSATASFTGTTWTFNHNLNNEYVIIDCYDSSNEEIIPQTIDLVTANQAVISFPVSVSGTAVASLGNGVVQASITNNTTNNISNSPINTISYNLGSSTSPSLYRQKLTISTPGVYNLHVSESGPYWVDLRGIGSTGSGSVNIYLWVDQLNALPANSGSTVMFSGQSGSGNYVAFRSIATGSSTTEYWNNGTTIGNSASTIARSSTQEIRSVSTISGNPAGAVKYPDGSLVLIAPAGNTAFPGNLYRYTGSNGTPIV